MPAEADTPITMRDVRPPFFARVPAALRLTPPPRRKIFRAQLWFWKPNAEYRALSTLKSIYRNTVGANALLELGVVPDDTGNIPPPQFALLQAFGDYVRACHSPAAAAASAAPVAAASASVSFPAQVIDRVLLQEDLAFGERVLSFDVFVDSEGGYDPVPVRVASGTAVGHKRILYFEAGPMNATKVSVTATLLREGADVPHWRALRAYAPCPLE